MPKRPQPVGPDTQSQVNADRLRSAVKLLREAGEKGITRQDLAKGLKASTRLVDRTIFLLVSDGAEIQKQRHTRDGASFVHLSLKKGPKWDEAVSPRALTALKIAMLALEQVGTEIWADHLDAFERLASPQLTSRDRIIFNSLATRVRMNGTVTDPQIMDPDVLAAVLMALGSPNGPLQLELTYTPPGRASWSRAVCPYCLTHDAFSGGAFLLVWDSEKRRAVHLRLNRIDHAKVLRVPAVIPNEAPLEHAARYQIGGWVESDPPFEVEVRVTGRTWPKALLESPPALPEIAVFTEGKDVKVRFHATEPYAPARWILQFGPDAEVLKPESVRNVVRMRLSEALSQYEVAEIDA